MKRYIENISDKDLIFSDLKIKVPKERIVDPFKLNPGLTSEQYHESLSIGSLGKALRKGKARLLSTRPVRSAATEITESMRPSPSRIRFNTSLDTEKQSYIEELTGLTGSDFLDAYDEIGDGFHEPVLEDESILDGNSPIQEGPEPEITQNTAIEDRYITTKTTGDR